jgi:ubiquitin-protein ligase
LAGGYIHSESTCANTCTSTHTEPHTYTHIHIHAHLHFRAHTQTCIPTFKNLAHPHTQYAYRIWKVDTTHIHIFIHAAYPDTPPALGSFTPRCTRHGLHCHMHAHALTCLRCCKRFRSYSCLEAAYDSSCTSTYS